MFSLATVKFFVVIWQVLYHRKFRKWSYVRQIASIFIVLKLTQFDALTTTFLTSGDTALVKWQQKENQTPIMIQIITLFSYFFQALLAWKFVKCTCPPRLNLARFHLWYWTATMTWPRARATRLDSTQDLIFSRKKKCFCKWEICIFCRFNLKIWLKKSQVENLVTFFA